MKDKKKIIGMLSVASGFASLIMVIIYNFAPIFSIYTDMNDRFVPAKSYVGWEVIFYSYGGQIIYGYHHFGFNIVLFLGMILPVLTLLIGGIRYMTGKGKKRMRLEIIMAVVTAIGAVILVNARDLVHALSTSKDIINEMEDAISNGNFKLLIYPIITCVVMILTALLKVVNAILIKNAKEEEEVLKEEISSELFLKKRKKKIIISLSSVTTSVLALVVLATVLMNMYAETMNYVFGGGAKEVHNVSGEDGNYYDYTCTSAEESKEYAREVTQEIASEGITLLKNENSSLPLAGGSKISVFGYGSINPYAQGSDENVSEALGEVYDVNPSIAALYDGATAELNATAFDSVKASYADYSDAAVVVFTRSYGEGNDASKDIGSAENNRHDLTLSNEELAMLQNVCTNFSNVVVLINSPNEMELGFTQVAEGEAYTDPYSGNTYSNFSNIKGVLWTGGFGSTGLSALDQILTGEVNPSGHLSDIYAADFTADPTYCNVGSFAYTNSLSMDDYYNNQAYFVEYEEGIYVGYKYYETAAYEAENGNYDGFDYDKAVVYPFGYGLSYSDFDMKYASEPTYDESSNQYTFQVEVTNTGSVAGKQVVQIYANPPYTAGGIEKAQVTLVGFGKTQVLDPGAKETVTITVDGDLLTSYDYKNNACYMLEEGDYNFYLSEDSHSWYDIDQMSDSEKSDYMWTYHVDTTKIYNDENDGKRTSDKTTATNVFDDETKWKFVEYTDAKEGYSTNFTRADFKDSFPTAPTGDDYTADDYVMQTLKQYNVWDDSEQTVTEKQTYGTSDTTYTLADMRGVDIDDDMWDDYINQFSLDSMLYMYGNGSWAEQADEDQGVPFSYDTDGPYGFFGHTGDFSQVNQFYTSIPVLGATWNTELSAKMGDAIAEEAAQFKDADGNQITGWYGPGINLHRTPFCGRNFEYFSEDSVLSGYMAASETSAASEKGLICLTKHFALNEQETNRQSNGLVTWANEQAIRELYFKPFEIYIKNAKMDVKYYTVDEDGNSTVATKTMSAANGIMTAYNRIGAVYAGASDALGVAREEWGFTGTFITDAGGQPNTYMNSDKALRAGNNLTLADNGDEGLYDYDSDTAIYYLKQSTKYLLYNKANSNAMEGISASSVITYSKAPWQIGLLVAQIVAGLLVLASIAYIILLVKGKIQLKDKRIRVTAENIEK